MNSILIVSASTKINELTMLLPACGGYVYWNYKGKRRAVLIRNTQRAFDS